MKKGVDSTLQYYQGEYAQGRSHAIRKLNEGTIKVIFSVDMFNEGVRNEVLTTPE